MFPRIESNAGWGPATNTHHTLPIAVVLSIRGGRDMDDEGILSTLHARYVGPFFRRIAQTLDEDASRGVFLAPINLVCAMALAVLLGPASKMYYERCSIFLYGEEIHVSTAKNGSSSPIETIHPHETAGDESSPPKAVIESVRRRPYALSRVSHVIDTVVWSARLFLLTSLVDLGRLLLVRCLGLAASAAKDSRKITTVFGFGIYLYWGCLRISALKLFLLKKVMKHSDMINDLGRLKVIHRLTDCALVVIGFFAFYEVLNFEMGYSAKSLLAVVSFGSAVVSFATKDIITNFLNGILLSASDRIYEGDYIAFASSKKSLADARHVQRVDRLGWLETALRGSDNILYTIPNTELLNSQISNLSRIKTSQVHQTLKFPYETIGRLPVLLKDIKSEIRKACPSIITDGSRPFRCYFVNFGPQQSHIEVFVDAHFRIAPFGDLYYENRQRCLVAIDSAIRKNQLEQN